MQPFSRTKYSASLRWFAPGFPPEWQQRKSWAAGFTIVEFVVVIVILGILSLIGMRAYGHFIDNARNTRAIAELGTIEKEIMDFFYTNDRYPITLTEIGREAMLDPWKNSYQYINFDTTANPEDKWRTKGKDSKGKGKGKGLDKSTAVNSDYDLYSTGRDRMSAPALEDEVSQDDIIRADDGSYLGLASEY